LVHSLYSGRGEEQFPSLLFQNSSAHVNYDVGAIDRYF